MLGGMARVVQIMESMGYRFPWGVGDQYFAEPSDAAAFRRQQDVNIASSIVGIRGRKHVRLYSLVQRDEEPHVVVGGVHRERWPAWFWFLQKPCDAAISFDDPREEIRETLEGTFLVSLQPFGNSNPFHQCSGSWPKSDRNILIIEEPS